MSVHIFPNFWLYVTEEDLQMVVLKSEEKIMENVRGGDQF